jgi:hypothetical protein
MLSLINKEGRITHGSIIPGPYPNSTGSLKHLARNDVVALFASGPELVRIKATFYGLSYHETLGFAEWNDADGHKWAEFIGKNLR